MTGSATQPSYRVRDGDVARDRDTVLALWQGNLGQGARMAAKYDWFYRQSPSGAPLLQLLLHGDDAVGVCSAGRRRMLWQGREIRAGVLVDLAVLPEHRSLGPAMILQQGMIAAGRRDLDVLYGFPNPKAAPVFKRIGYRKLADMVRYARVLRHADYLRRRLPGWLAVPAGIAVDLAARTGNALRRLFNRRLRAQWQDHADARMDALWSGSPHAHGLLAIRDAAHLQWRFDRAPFGKTRYLLLSEYGGEAISAWFATQADGNTLHIRDFWSLDATTGIAPRYLAALVSATRAKGHAAISVEMATTPARLAGWRALGFVERGRRPVFGNWSDPTAMEGDALDLHLTCADEDE